MEPKGLPQRPNWSLKWANGAYKMTTCGQVSDFYWFGIDFGSCFWAFWEQIPSIIASKIDAQITAENIVEISCKTVLKSMRNLLKFIEFHWKTMWKINDFQRPEKPWFLLHVCSKNVILYVFGCQKSMKNIENPTENPYSKRVCKNDAKIM